MRYIYSLILYLCSPFILQYLKSRGRHEPRYKENWGERFGFGIQYEGNKPVIWLHAVSVGETRAMSKIVELFQERYPEYQLLITQSSVTGRATARQMYENVILCYLPYDLPHAIQNFYKLFKPTIGIIMETEIWPNVLHYAKKNNIPLFLVNARLSPKSFVAYKRIRYLLEPFINKFSAILAQDQISSDYFGFLGYKGYLEVVGNTKFDLTINPELPSLANRWLTDIKYKKVVVFASTREGDEKLLIDNLPKIFDYLVVIVPRHPERFAEVEDLVKGRRLNYQKRSLNMPIAPDTQIFIGDSMGEMASYYSMASITIMGGSFNKHHGGQNLIESLYLNVPVICGPCMSNFEHITTSALAEECIVQVGTMKDAIRELDKLLNDDDLYTILKNNCQKFIMKRTGASEKIVDYTGRYL